jgi:hypothetical protein
MALHKVELPKSAILLYRIVKLQKWLLKRLLIRLWIPIL